MSADEPILAEFAPPQRDRFAEWDQWRRRRMWRHVAIFSLAAGILSSALVLEVRDRTEVTLAGGSLAMPATCWWQRVWRMDCPGCGMTRSVVCTAGGDLASAFRFNPVGPLLAVVLAYQLPYRAVQWRRLYRRRREFWHPDAQWIVWPLTILLVAQWCWKLL